MKKVFLTALAMLVSIATIAQDFSIWTHIGNHPLSQCYDILEMSDGNFVVKEAIFDKSQNDIGYILYKITPEGQTMDSLFIETYNIYALHPMLRDPNSDNSNIMTSFYYDVVNGIDRKYYKATYFNDNFEITDEVVAEYPDTLEFPKRFMLDSKSDIICRIPGSDNHFKFVRMGLDGEIKTISADMSSATSVSQHPLCELSSDPLKYAFASFSDNMRLTLEIFDEDFKCDLMVTCLDKEMNFQWEANPISDEFYGMFGNYGLTATKSGGVALSGWWVLGTEIYSQSKKIYAVVFGNPWSTEEHPDNGNLSHCYPNPAGSVLNIDFAENANCQSIKIY